MTDGVAMSDEFTNLVVKADRRSVAELKAAIEPLPGARVQDQLVRGLTGDPDIWILTAKVAAATAAQLVGALRSILDRNTVSYLKIGDMEFRGNVKPEDAKSILKQLETYHRATKS